MHLLHIQNINSSSFPCVYVLYLCVKFLTNLKITTNLNTKIQKNKRTHINVHNWNLSTEDDSINGGASKCHKFKKWLYISLWNVESCDKLKKKLLEF